MMRNISCGPSNRPRSGSALAPLPGTPRGFAPAGPWGAAWAPHPGSSCRRPPGPGSGPQWKREPWDVQKHAKILGKKSGDLEPWDSVDVDDVVLYVGPWDEFMVNMVLWCKSWPTMDANSTPLPKDIRYNPQMVISCNFLKSLEQSLHSKLAWLGKVTAGENDKFTPALSWRQYSHRWHWHLSPMPMLELCNLTSDRQQNHKSLGCGSHMPWARLQVQDPCINFNCPLFLFNSLFQCSSRKQSYCAQGSRKKSNIFIHFTKFGHGSVSVKTHWRILKMNNG